MGKTIKQIADELGVSKTAVRNKMTDEVKTKFAETVSGVFYIDEQGEKLIKSAFSVHQPKTKVSGISTNQFAEVSGKVSGKVSAQDAVLETLQKTVSLLQQQLQVKDKQLQEKDEQIKKLADSLAKAQELTDHAQQLHKADMVIALPEQSEGKWWKFWNRKK